MFHEAIFLATNVARKVVRKISRVEAILHEAIFLATCLATRTNEKHCKLQTGCHTFAIFFFATCNSSPGNCLQLFLHQLEIFCERKTGSVCLIFTKLRCRLRWTCHTKQLVSQRCEKLRIFLIFLQLATQHFVAVAGCKTGVLREIFLATCLATNVARQVARKIASCNMALTPPATATKCCIASCKKSRNILKGHVTRGNFSCNFLLRDKLQERFHV